MRVIVLAAGQGFQLDGVNKCLIRDPQDGKCILDKIILAFPRYQITLVVGYQAINIMHNYPKLHYIYNENWGITNNSYSLGLALTTEPCYVLSSDLLFEPALISAMDKAGENIILTENRENRTLTAINCVTEHDCITETYQGILRNQEDPEAIGIFKISNIQLLRKWKANCLQYPNLFVGQNIPLNMSDAKIHAFNKGAFRFFEVNNPLDYIRLINDCENSIVSFSA